MIIEKFVNIISNTPKARAVGHFGDIFNVIRDMVTHIDGGNLSYTYVQTVHTLLKKY